MIGSGFNVVVVIVAALNLVLDFDLIESGAVLYPPPIDQIKKDESLRNQERNEERRQHEALAFARIPQVRTEGNWPHRRLPCDSQPNTTPQNPAASRYL